MIVGGQIVDGIGVTVQNTLALTTNSLTTTRATLDQTKTTIQEATTGIGNIETAIADASETVNQADTLVGEVFQIVSVQVPDSIDSVQATIPPAVDAAQSFLSNVETAVVTAGDTANQTGPLLNQVIRFSSTGVPETLDIVNSTLPSTAQAVQALLTNVETTMMDASETINQTDQMLGQVSQIVTQQVPDSINAAQATIPSTVNVTKQVLGDVQTTMVNASDTVNQADAALNQVISIASSDVPNTLDAVYGAIPGTADVTKQVLSGVKTTMVDASGAVDQADMAVDQIVTIASSDVPNTLDAVYGTIPPIGDVSKQVMSGVQATMANTGETLRQTDQIMRGVSPLVTQGVPDSLDAVYSVLPGTADVSKQVVSNVGTVMEATAATMNQADMAVNQIVAIASSDVPNMLDAIYATIPPTADVTKQVLSGVKTTMVDASGAVDQADMAGNQIVTIASSDVPNTLDAV
jgi:hypothetical protein